MKDKYICEEPSYITNYDKICNSSLEEIASIITTCEAEMYNRIMEELGLSKLLINSDFSCLYKLNKEILQRPYKEGDLGEDTYGN